MKDAKTILNYLRKNISFSDAVQSLSIGETCLLIDKADSLYYRPGLTSPLSDAEYDTLREHLKMLNPTDFRLTRVGAPYNPAEISTKVKHLIPMGSLDNTDDGILGYEPWVEWVKDKLRGFFTDSTFDNLVIFASLKVDGGSICATYKNGVLMRVATRGNGEYGEDITANAANFQGLPTVLSKPIDAEIRGEAVLYKQDFLTICQDIPEEERSNPRNVGNGILGRHDGKDSEHIRFLAFNLYLGESSLNYNTEEEKFAVLKELGFTPIPHKVCNTMSEFQTFYNNIADGRDKLPFEIDGIVVVVNDLKLQSPFVNSDPKSVMRPKYARAVKFPHKSNTTILEGLDITVGHTRAIIPTAKLKSVRVGGVNVDSALLNNYDEIKRLDLAIGDEVEVILAGDIIPKVIRKVKSVAGARTLIAEPTNCPACGTATTRLCRGKAGAVTYCSNVRCSAAVFAKLDHWIGTSKKGVGILDIGDVMIKALWQKGLLTDPADLYTLTVDSIKDVVLENGGKIGQSRATKIIANINAKRHLPLHVFLGSLGIELLGRRRVQLIRDAANNQLDTLDDWLDLQKLRTIQVPGFGDVIRDSVVAGIEENLPLIKKFLTNGVTVGAPIAELNAVGVVDKGQPVEDKSKPFAGLSFCFTGTRSNIDDVERLGGTIKSGVSKGLSVLVQLDALSTSNKTKKADEYGTLIVSLDYLQRAIRGEVDLVADVRQRSMK